MGREETGDREIGQRLILNVASRGQHVRFKLRALGKQFTTRGFFNITRLNAGEM